MDVMQRIVAQHVVQAMKKQAGLKPKTKQWRGMFHLIYAVKQQIVNITKTTIVLQSTLMLNRLRIKILVVQNVQVLN